MHFHAIARYQAIRVDGRCGRRREFVRGTSGRTSGTSRFQSGRGTHNLDTPLTSATGLAGSFRNSDKCRPACTSPGLHQGCSCNRTARTMPAGSWPFGGTHRMSCLRACPTWHKPTTVRRGLLLQVIRFLLSSWHTFRCQKCDWNRDTQPSRPWSGGVCSVSNPRAFDRSCRASVPR